MKVKFEFNSDVPNQDHYTLAETDSRYDDLVKTGRKICDYFENNYFDIPENVIKMAVTEWRNFHLDMNYYLSEEIKSMQFCKLGMHSIDYAVYRGQYLELNIIAIVSEEFAEKEDK
jgi:hypothetical protein